MKWDKIVVSHSHGIYSGDWVNPMTYSILDWKIHNASRELKESNTTPQAEFWIVLTQVRSYVFSIQYSASHGIVNPVWIYNRTDHLFHTTISSHYILDNTIWLLLLYSHIGLRISILYLCFWGFICKASSIFNSINVTWPPQPLKFIESKICSFSL